MFDKSIETEKTPSVKNPRISVNKLAEYIEVNANRRKTIVQDAKSPMAFIAARYADTRRAMVEFLQTGKIDILNAAIESISAKETSSEFYENDKKNSLECLNKFLDFNYVDFESFSISESTVNTLVTIKGLDISVNPDLIVRMASKGKKYIGAIKLAIYKTPMGKSQQETVALMVKNYLQIAQLDDFTISPNLCLSIDAFANKVVGCPKSEKARMKIIESACEEIVLRWTNL